MVFFLGGGGRQTFFHFSLFSLCLFSLSHLFLSPLLLLSVLLQTPSGWRPLGRLGVLDSDADDLGEVARDDPGLDPEDREGAQGRR